MNVVKNKTSIVRSINNVMKNDADGDYDEGYHEMTTTIVTIIIALTCVVIIAI